MPSKMGTICSFLMLILMLNFTFYKVQILQERKSVDVLSVVSEDHFDENSFFGAEQGLNIAVALFNPKRVNIAPLDPTYGKIDFKIKNRKSLAS